MEAIPKIDTEATVAQRVIPNDTHQNLKKVLEFLDRFQPRLSQEQGLGKRTVVKKVSKE